MRRSHLIPFRLSGPASVPTNLTAVAISQTQINLSWTGSFDPAGGPAKDYGVYRVGTGLLGYVAALAYSDTGLTAGTTYTYNVSARSQAGVESSQSIPASATTQPNLPSITTVSLPDPIQNAAYTFGMTGTGGTLPYTWSLTVKPSWLSINAASGVLSGTPTAAGAVPVTVRLADNSGNSVTQGYTLTVDPASSSATLYNGQIFTVTGSGFGTKTQTAFARDKGTAPAGTLSSVWTSSVPDGSVVAADRIQNYNPAVAGATSTNVGLPHSYITQYTAGCHGGNNANDGFDVAVTLGFTPPSPPYVVKMSWYERCDYALWTFTQQGTGEFNYKCMAFSQSANLYGGPAYIYFNFNPPGIGDNTTVSGGISTSGRQNGMFGPERNGNGGSSNAFWGSMKSPFNNANGWVRKDWEFQVSPTDPNGYMVFIDGYVTSPKPAVYANWTIDNTAAGQRSASIGGYSVMYPFPGANYRYFADMMVDISGTGAKRSAQLYLSTSPTYAQATATGVPNVHTSGAITIEQDLQAGTSSWTNTSIAAQAWIAEIPVGTTVYGHVVCENGTIFQNVSPGPWTVVAVPQPFDFYISPTGNDANAGTLAAPWSITALNSKQATYAAKRVGLLPGTYTGGTAGTLFAIHSGMTTSSCALQIQGGSVANPTFVGASTAGGVYSPPVAGTGPTANLNFSNAGTRSTKDGHCIGQSVIGANIPSSLGNVTISGIGVTLGTTSLIGFQDSGAGTTLFPNVTVQDCELFDSLAATSANNPGSLFCIGRPTNWLVKNTKIHKTRTAGGSFTPYGQAGIMVNQTTGTGGGCSMVVDHCMIYDGGQCIEGKNNYANIVAQYSYLDFGTGLANYTGTAFQFGIFGNIQAPSTSVVHKYNVICGGVNTQPTDGTNNQGSVTLQNCTLYCGPVGGHSVGNDMFCFTNQGATGSGHMNHCVVWSDGGYDPANNGIGSIGFNATGGGWTSNFNCLPATCTFGFPGHLGTNFTTWKNTGGFDANSTTVAVSPFVSSPVSANIGSFVVTSGNLLATDGQPQGALNASGTAADGSGAIGTSF